MLLTHFAKIPEFADLPPFELRALAERAHVLCMPKGRWLVQGKRSTSCHLYLLRGIVETFEPDRRLVFVPGRAIRHFYPGCKGARTLSSTQILRVDSTQREFLTAQRPRASVVETADGDAWLRRFLGSQMMATLPQSTWQSLLRNFRRRSFASHAKIISKGARGDFCYVLESGRALVHDGNRVLCHLTPGDFFGEDALITEGVRNADVSALEAVRVHAIERGLFRRLLFEQLVEFVPRVGEGVQLNIGQVSIPRSVPVQLDRIREMASGFDPGERYFVVGGTLGQRALCAFLLRQRGILATPVGALPSPSARPKEKESRTTTKLWSDANAE